MNRIRVLIADDHPIVRQGLRDLLETEPDLQVVDEAQDGLEALEKVRAHHPDVLLVDIEMPGLSGLKVAQLIGRTLPGTRIVILSMHAKETYARHAIEAGALGYLLKGQPSEEIPEAIRAVHRGRYFLSSSLPASLLDTCRPDLRREPADEGYRRLSERERQVFLLLIEGSSATQIADILCVSIKTVEKHRANISDKLGAENPVEMLKYAIRRGLIDPETW